MEPIKLGGYPAKRCARRTHNQYSPSAPPPTGIDPQLQAILDAGLAFESEVFDLLSHHYAGSAQLLVIDPELDFNGCQDATVAAITAKVPVIAGGRLPDVNGRVGAPDLLIRCAGGYLPVDIKNHRTLSSPTKSVSTKTLKTVLVSTLTAPADRHCRSGFSNAGSRWRDDALQLAHYTRMLQELGFHPTSGPVADPALLIGGIIGTSDLTELLGEERGITWYDLAAPVERTYSASAPDHTKLRSPLERYDHEFGFRVQVAEAARAGRELVRPFRIAECHTCEWFDYCAQVVGADDASFALETGHLNVRQWQYLYGQVGDDNNLTVEQLAGVDPACHTDAFSDQSVGTTAPHKRLADAVRRAAMTLTATDLEPLGPNWPAVPAADIEVDFDIEWDTAGLIYQWGLRIRDGQDDSSARYQPIVSFEPLGEEIEEALANEFADRIHQLCVEAARTGRSVAVFHWSDPERSRTRKFPRVEAVLDAVAVDLYKWFKDQFFARTSMSIKRVASLFGFQWGVDDADGFMSQLKIDVARSDGPEAQAAQAWCLSYNEADVAAQAAIRDGLRERGLRLGAP